MVACLVIPTIVENVEFVEEGAGEKHNWTKKSIFWEFSYWKINLLCQNLDVMHIKKIFFDNIFNTVMDVKGKTKDNVKARMDLLEHYQRPELELCCTYICPNFSLYLIHFSWYVHVKCR